MLPLCLDGTFPDSLPRADPAFEEALRRLHAAVDDYTGHFLPRFEHGRHQVGPLVGPRCESLTEMAMRYELDDQTKRHVSWATLSRHPNVLNVLKTESGLLYVPYYASGSLYTIQSRMSAEEVIVVLRGVVCRFLSNATRSAVFGKMAQKGS